MSHTIVRTDAEIECPLLDAGLRERGCRLMTVPSHASASALGAAAEAADLLLTCYASITREILEGAPRLRGVVKYGVGIDAIDTEAARDLQIPVVNVPEYAEETVAEGAFTMLLALLKQLIPIDREMHASGWLWPSRRWLGNDLAGKTVGLVGLGRIGRSFARMAGAGFRARVLGFDPHVSASQMLAAGVEKHDELHEMLSQCDIVSMHCVLTPQTHHLIDRAALAAMSPETIFVNVSRGALVDEAALVDALLGRRLAGAALDVFSDEPLALEGHPLAPLFELPNVILSPHSTFYTKEAMARLELETLERCDELLAGGPVRVKSKDPRLRAQTTGVVFDG